MRQETIRLKRAQAGPAKLSGEHKIRTGNKLMFEANITKRAADLKARNAYRAAIGLPPATS